MLNKVKYNSPCEGLSIIHTAEYSCQLSDLFAPFRAVIYRVDIVIRSILCLSFVTYKHCGKNNLHKIIYRRFFESNIYNMNKKTPFLNFQF